MEAVVTVGAGFLLAVLWFDLMFDVQVRSSTASVDAVRSIATYYRRVTTDARPMNLLVALAMLVTAVAIGVEFGTDDIATWVPWVSVGLGGAPLFIAALRTVPRAVALGVAVGEAPDAPPASTPTRDHHMMARRILAEHVLCFVCISGLIAVQLVSAA